MGCTETDGVKRPGVSRGSDDDGPSLVVPVAVIRSTDSTGKDVLVSGT